MLTSFANVGSESVPVDEIPLPETVSLADLKEKLELVLASEIPAFLVRADSIPERKIHTNTDLRSIVMTELAREGEVFRTAFVMPDISGTLQRREIGLGELHHDSSQVAAGRVTSLDIHTTTRGSGRVLVANSGPFFAIPQQERLQPSYTEVKVQLNQMLNAGGVDPRFIEPTVYAADLALNDNVIFAAFNDKGPVWHRFDTVEGPRIACVSEIEKAA